MSAASRARATPVLVAAGAAIAVATLGALVTDLGPWYQGLRMPAWKPPDWAFGPIWTLIFGCAMLAGLFAWRARPTPLYRGRLLALFAVNALLNVSWSVLFFRVHRPDWAFGEVLLFWTSIAILVVVAGRASRRAAALLIPYLVWVTIAAFLNLAIVRLNPP
jgi:tryptophan-rich sensory protein